MIDWDSGTVDRFVAADPDGEFVMLNLLRFRADGGRETYAAYARSTRLAGKKIGLRVVHYGACGPPLVAGATEWDAVMLVRYPSRRAFRDLLNDADYAAGAHLRRDALVESVLQPTFPGPPPQP